VVALTIGHLWEKVRVRGFCWNLGPLSCGRGVMGGPLVGHA
jgi:hypothetical protein